MALDGIPGSAQIALRLSRSTRRSQIASAILSLYADGRPRLGWSSFCMLAVFPLRPSHMEHRGFGRHPGVGTDRPKAFTVDEAVADRFGDPVIVRGWSAALGLVLVLHVSRLPVAALAQTPPPHARLPYFLGAIRASIQLSALILRRWRAKCSLSKTQVTLSSTPVFFT